MPWNGVSILPPNRFRWKNVTLTPSSFAMTELHITLATIFRRFELELFETKREVEIDSARDCFLAEMVPEAVGVRIKVSKVLEE